VIKSDRLDSPILSALLRPIINTIALRTAYDLMLDGFFPPLVLEIDTIAMSNTACSLTESSVCPWTSVCQTWIIDQLKLELSRATDEGETETPKASSSRLLSLNPARKHTFRISSFLSDSLPTTMSLIFSRLRNRPANRAFL